LPSAVGDLPLDLAVFCDPLATEERLESEGLFDRVPDLATSSACVFSLLLDLIFIVSNY
jgi:hypothetical protein